MCVYKAEIVFVSVKLAFVVGNVELPLDVSVLLELINIKC